MGQWLYYKQCEHHRPDGQPQKDTVTWYEQCSSDTPGEAEAPAHDYGYGVGGDVVTHGALSSVDGGDKSSLWATALDCRLYNVRISGCCVQKHME